MLPYLKDQRINGFIVPLYKHTLFEAYDASSLIYNTLTHKQQGIFEALNAYDGEGKYSQSNPLVVRVFLTSSRSYKSYRSIKNIPKLAHIYANLPLPKFIWVAELSTYELFIQEKNFGEIIVDATATKNASEKQ